MHRVHLEIQDTQLGGYIPTHASVGGSFFLPHHVSRFDWASSLTWVFVWEVESATHITVVMAAKASGVS